MEENRGSSLVRSEQVDALIKRCHHLKPKMSTSHDKRQVSFLHSRFSFSFHVSFCFLPSCLRPRVQLCAATACASMGASVGLDPLSSVTVLQGSTDPAASMVSRNSQTMFHIQSLFFSPFNCLISAPLSPLPASNKPYKVIFYTHWVSITVSGRSRSWQ